MSKKKTKMIMAATLATLVTSTALAGRGGRVVRPTPTPTPNPAETATASMIGQIKAGTTVDELHLHGLKPFAGRELVVFYVNGREATIGIEGTTLTVRSVKMPPVSVQIDSKGEAVIPSVVVPRGSFHVFNYVVFAVPRAAGKALYLRNSDGSVPQDPRFDGTANVDTSRLEFSHDAMKFISVPALREIKAEAPSRGYVELEAGKDF